MDETGFKLLDWLFRSLLQDALWYCLKRPWLPAIIFLPLVAFGDQIFASGLGAALYTGGAIALIAWNWRRERAMPAAKPTRTSSSKRSPLHLLADLFGAIFAIAFIGLLLVNLDHWMVQLAVLVPFGALIIWGYRQQRRAEQRLASRPPLDNAIRRPVDER